MSDPLPSDGPPPGVRPVPPPPCSSLRLTESGEESGEPMAVGSKHVAPNNKESVVWDVEDSSGGVRSISPVRASEVCLSFAPRLAAADPASTGSSQHLPPLSVTREVRRVADPASTINSDVLWNVSKIFVSLWLSAVKSVSGLSLALMGELMPGEFCLSAPSIPLTLHLDQTLSTQGGDTWSVPPCSHNGPPSFSEVCTTPPSICIVSSTCCCR